MANQNRGTIGALHIGMAGEMGLLTGDIENQTPLGQPLRMM